MKFQKGETYICTNSKSNAYKKGQTYVCFVNQKGSLCLKGSDGFEDIVTNLVSKFKRVEDV